MNRRAFLKFLSLPLPLLGLGATKPTPPKTIPAPTVISLKWSDPYTKKLSTTVRTWTINSSREFLTAKQEVMLDEAFLSANGYNVSYRQNGPDLA